MLVVAGTAPMWTGLTRGAAAATDENRPSGVDTDEPAECIPECTPGALVAAARRSPARYFCRWLATFSRVRDGTPMRAMICFGAALSTPSSATAASKQACRSGVQTRRGRRGGARRGEACEISEAGVRGGDDVAQEVARCDGADRGAYAAGSACDGDSRSRFTSGAYAGPGTDTGGGSVGGWASGPAARKSGAPSGVYAYGVAKTVSVRVAGAAVRDIAGDFLLVATS